MKKTFWLSPSTNVVIKKTYLQIHFDVNRLQYNLKFYLVFNKSITNINII